MRLEVGRRRFETAQLAQHRSQVAVRLGKIWPQRDGSPIAGHGLIELAQAVEDVAQAVVGLNQLGLEIGGTLVMSHRFGELTLLLQHVAQVVVDLGDVGPQRQHLAIGRGRLGQSTGKMFALGQRKESPQITGRWRCLAGRRHQGLILARRRITSHHCRPDSVIIGHDEKGHRPPAAGEWHLDTQRRRPVRTGGWDSCSPLQRSGATFLKRVVVAAECLANETWIGIADRSGNRGSSPPSPIRD